MPTSQLRGLLATWLRDAMRRTNPETGRRWTQNDLAKAADVSRQTIWTILEEKADPRSGTIEALAAATGAPLPVIGAESVGEVFRVEIAKVRAEVANYERAKEPIPPPLVRIWLDNLEAASAFAHPAAATDASTEQRRRDEGS